MSHSVSIPAANLALMIVACSSAVCIAAQRRASEPSTPVRANQSKDSTAVSASPRAIEPQTRDADYKTLINKNLTLPIENIDFRNILDTFKESRPGGRMHEATDIVAPRGTPVRAMEDGTIAKLFLSKSGGNTIYEFDPEERYCYYYAHLDGYAKELKDGMHVTRGQVIGYVGTTGNAPPNAPHLHLAILKLGPEKIWWKNTSPIDPYPVLMHLRPRG